MGISLHFVHDRSSDRSRVKGNITEANILCSRSYSHIRARFLICDELLSRLFLMIVSSLSCLSFEFEASVWATVHYVQLLNTCVWRCCCHSFVDFWLGKLSFQFPDRIEEGRGKNCMLRLSFEKKEHHAFHPEIYYKIQRANFYGVPRLVTLFYFRAPSNNDWDFLAQKASVRRNWIQFA